MADELVHTEQCFDARLKCLRLWMRFLAQYPSFCRYCSGAGYTEYSYDPSPSGVGLSPGRMTDSDPCPECEGAEAPECGLCGKGLFFDPEHGELRRICGCPQDEFEPQQPECFCWEVLVEKARTAFFKQKGGE